MSTQNVELNGNHYVIGKLNAIQQFHVVRRLAPVLSELKGVMAEVRAGKTPESIDPFVALIPVVEVISKMPDAEAEEVIFKLLAAVEMKQSSGGYAKLTSAPDNLGRVSLMFNDLDLPTMMQLAVKVLMFNLGNFLNAFQSPSPDANLKQKEA